MCPPYRLPQLAVSAKFLVCLLMVVIGGAVSSMVHSVRLYNYSSGRYVQINDTGHVFTVDEYNTPRDYLNLTIRSLDFNMKLSIYSERTKRYLCFNKKWRLRGMPLRGRNRDSPPPRCQWYEELYPSGYNTYRSVVSQTHFLAFTAAGAAMPPSRKNPPEKSKSFVKRSLIDKDPIGQHNKKVNNGNPPSSVYTSQHKRRHSKRGKTRK